jgi:ATP adenylyltransferase
MAREYFFNFDKLDYVRGKRPEGCILCHICSGSEKVPDLSVFHNNLVQVSINLYPYNPGHIMVFPVRHVTDIRKLEREEWLAMQDAQNMMLDCLEKTYQPTGYNIGYNLGQDSGASIPHIHLHIIPRYPRELGIADILTGKRLLVEDPFTSRDKLVAGLKKDQDE